MRYSVAIKAENCNKYALFFNDSALYYSYSDCTLWGKKNSGDWWGKITKQTGFVAYPFDGQIIVPKFLKPSMGTLWLDT
jgi:hypothetical protein